MKKLYFSRYFSKLLQQVKLHKATAIYRQLMNLRRDLFLCASFLALSLLIIPQVVGVAEANPLTRGLPSQGEFDLSIQSPSNNTLFGNGDIPLDFTVNYTEQWNLKPYWCRTSSMLLSRCT
jgi:hypothetical protein